MIMLLIKQFDMLLICLLMSFTYLLIIKNNMQGLYFCGCVPKVKLSMIM